jgi:hypothetical protein
MATKRKPVTLGVGVVIDSPDLEKAVANAKAATQAEVMRRVTVRLHGVANPLAEKVRGGIRRIPSWNLYGTSVRSTLAGNVEARTVTGAGYAGVRININPVGLPDGLPAAMDTDKKRNVPGHGYRYAFRHPVFGNREVWANQAGGPYFRGTLNRNRKISRDAVKAAMDEVISEIAGK